jgi:hypothetical protein
MTRRIGLISGSGQFPVLFAKAARRKGYEVHAAAYRNEAAPELKQFVDTVEWLYLGQIKRLIKYFRKCKVSQAVMLGAVRKTRMFTDFRPDTKAIAMIAGMRHTHDDTVLCRFADALEAEGIQIMPSTFLIPELLAPPGIWTQRRPSRSEYQDIAMGWDVAKTIGDLDIGQCIVVGGGSILAVEAIEGTDAAIRRGGELGKGQAVVVKVCKPAQDTRFDVPAVGTGTIEAMIAANIKTLALEAGKAVVFDRREMIDLANHHKMAIAALNDGHTAED